MKTTYFRVLHEICWIFLSVQKIYAHLELCCRFFRFRPPPMHSSSITMIINFRKWFFFDFFFEKNHGFPTTISFKRNPKLEEKGITHPPSRNNAIVLTCKENACQISSNFRSVAFILKCKWYKTLPPQFLQIYPNAALQNRIIEGSVSFSYLPLRRKIFYQAKNHFGSFCFDSASILPPVTWSNSVAMDSSSLLSICLFSHNITTIQTISICWTTR